MFSYMINLIFSDHRPFTWRATYFRVDPALLFKKLRSCSPARGTCPGGWQSRITLSSSYTAFARPFRAIIYIDRMTLYGIFRITVMIY